MDLLPSPLKMDNNDIPRHLQRKDAPLRCRRCGNTSIPTYQDWCPSCGESINPNISFFPSEDKSSHQELYFSDNVKDLWLSRHYSNQDHMVV